ncbi:Ferrochelatase [Dissostichus eleginoides]|uniref:Ferrochelatase n=1 Tax=Dissostichus eleginoides TaxID=100907 RepID=A0AAD9BBS9_DISEL|nr:Ferrochelatase [Dissostichus eleginoides]
MGVKPGPINSMVFTKPVPNRMLTTGVRSGFYRGMVGPLPDPCMFRVTGAYEKFSIEDRPLVTIMNMRADKPLVESAFGMVQEDSVLSYQMPALKSRDIVLHNGAPPTPHLPLEGYDILLCSPDPPIHHFAEYRDFPEES